MIHELFSTSTGERIYNDALRAIRDHSMHAVLERGVLVGFSGGADSVMLLLTLLNYRENTSYFPIKAIHVNHMIRGDEATRDEQFSKEFCEALGVDFATIRINIPALAASEKIGLEEAARNARYKAFFDVINSDSNYFSIAVAHNATDNLETIIFNMMRGSGISGMCGIPPVRDNIVRPLIYSSKESILDALNESGIQFVTDSTNLSTEYSRNYIRHEIIPRLAHISPSPETMGSRLSANLQQDRAFIEDSVSAFFADNEFGGEISNAALSKLHKSLFFRVLCKMCKSKSDSIPERVHSEAIFKLLSEKNFSYSLPGNLQFVCRDGMCSVTDQKGIETRKIKQKLSEGINKINGYSTVIIVSDAQNIKSYSNIYNFTIQAKLPFDIINGSLYVTSREEGDAYSYGGITRKLKKLFNDRKIPTSQRNNVPVFRDETGILWVPGFGVRDTDDTASKNTVIALVEPKDYSGGDIKLFTPTPKAK